MRIPAACLLFLALPALADATTGASTPTAGQGTLAPATSVPATPAQATTAPSSPPPTEVPAKPTVDVPAAVPVREVRETLHGVEVSDPYRWIEDTTSPEAQAYFRSQGDRARQVLDRNPGRAALAARISELSGAQSTVTALSLAAGKVFYLKLAPGQATPALCVRDGFAGPEQVLVDPAKHATPAGGAAIDWYHPSPDGRLVAYGVSIGSSGDTVLRVLQVQGARDTGVAIDRTRFNAALAWHHDSRAFYYARIPEGGPADPAHRFAGIRVYRHVVGRPAGQDEIAFASGVGGARDVPEHVYPSLVVPEDSIHVYAIARHGARREIAVYLASVVDLAKGLPRWTKVVGFEDGVTAMQAWKDDLYLLTHKGAPRYKVVALKVGKAELSRPRALVPEGDTVILGMALAADALYLRTTVGGLERLERLNFALGASRTPEFLRTSFDVAITQLLTHPRRPGAVLLTQGFIEPPAVITVEAKTGNLHNTGLQPPARADFAEIDEVRLYAPSHDGVKVPVTLLYRKSTMLTAANPTILIGHGAYGQSQVPSFDATRLAWLERGGIIAWAHIRGGGEYGEEWHRAGQKGTKENSILDFIACAEFLVKYGFTSPARLAILGTGAGGIPAAGAMVRRPDLFAAVVPRRALLDMLRYEFGRNGPSEVPEFGSVASREGFEALRRVSAYHQVQDGTAYPAVLLAAGMLDPRAEPWHAGKLAARLQAASTGGKPVLLRVDWQEGARERREEELADVWSFLLWQFGNADFAPR